MSSDIWFIRFIIFYEYFAIRSLLARKKNINIYIDIIFKINALFSVAHK